ncbi:hypothetical protein BU15DRAFT_81130 [Melanogaster broomeanus]|nr:hypothetical protein BU15DRAFT_81130 [Melanogaster broomeanus]
MIVNNSAYEWASKTSKTKPEIGAQEERAVRRASSQSILDLPAVVKLPDNVPDHGLNDMKRDEVHVEREDSQKPTVEQLAEELAAVKRKLAALEAATSSSTG